MTLAAPQASKQHKAFIRKLYLAHLIDSEQHNLGSLQALTGMPRRTLQDSITALKDIGIHCGFVQQGERHNAGFYRIDTWGPISPAWVDTHVDEMKSLLEIAN
ncbi:winged helix-turn-helix domain-containing protein [Shewanella gelidii]|uniref:Helix-turn-helix domain-containing protein n=1 Tax=Shewanella gelidii TaxID=1642821 RepID=A0A917JN99_9GAMM|nr:winged helix-turn-helix domain-containing protein [Shewanella gelidii]MCL1099292.1 winged helix-turn-helix domain-containing protein [Shewanella gelidii]GGI77640.1 hypothetical protein GCM10009332_13770 [Shewanella gelidii]